MESPTDSDTVKEKACMSNGDWNLLHRFPVGILEQESFLRVKSPKLHISESPLESGCS
jgi:hypothetical protein